MCRGTLPRDITKCFNGFWHSVITKVYSFLPSIDMLYAWSASWHRWTALLSSFPPREASDLGNTSITRVSDKAQGQHFHFCQGFCCERKQVSVEAFIDGNTHTDDHLENNRWLWDRGVAGRSWSGLISPVYIWQYRHLFISCWSATRHLDQIIT